MAENTPSPIPSRSSGEDNSSTEKSYLESANIQNILHKELDMIQAIITRMGSNSFQCKGWLIGIFAVVLAINKDSTFFGAWALILIMPVLLFWYLDGFFLYIEQRYRDLYNYTVKKRTDLNYIRSLHTEKETEIKQRMYDLRYTSFEHQELVNASIWKHFNLYRNRKTTRHQPLMGFDLKQEPEQGPIEKKDRVITIFSAIFSKTLKPFYLTISSFVFFIALVSCVKQYFFNNIPLPAKEPVTIQLDSVTLQLLLKNSQVPLPVHVTVEVKNPQPPVSGE